MQMNEAKATNQKQTYLDAPTIQSLLVNLKDSARYSESDIKFYKGQVQNFWRLATGKGTDTFTYFVELNQYKNYLRSERKYLAKLVKQIKGFKAMLKDAV